MNESPSFQPFQHQPSVLVPGFHLGVREVQLGGQFHAVLHTEVLLAFEALLESVELVVGEGSPRLTHLFRLAAAVALLRRHVVATVAFVASVGGASLVTTVC